MVDVSKADIEELYAIPAVYSDRIYTSHDIPNRLVRLGFAENVQGSADFRLRSAIIITETGLDSLIDLLMGVQKKMKDGVTTETLQ